MNKRYPSTARAVPLSRLSEGIFKLPYRMACVFTGTNKDFIHCKRHSRFTQKPTTAKACVIIIAITHTPRPPQPKQTMMNAHIKWMKNNTQPMVTLCIHREFIVDRLNSIRCLFRETDFCWINLCARNNGQRDSVSRSLDGWNRWHLHKSDQSRWDAASFIKRRAYWTGILRKSWRKSIERLLLTMVLLIT